VSSDLRAQLTSLIALELAPTPGLVTHGERRREGYLERAVSYAGSEGPVPALLLLPDEPSGAGAVVHHQHNGQWHLGKSEVAGLRGDRWQGFGPALAHRGVTVLAPDAIGFEDRRPGGPGTDERASDGNDYFATMGHRLVRGRPLMGSVLADAGAAHSVLAAHEGVDAQRVGAVGHSMGGAYALWHAALDARVAFAAASGCACTYRNRIAHGVGIDAAQAIPGVLELGDLDAVAALVAPRPLLIASAEQDKYSKDAPAIAAAAAHAYRSHGVPDALVHTRARGGHALTEERFQAIVDWVVARGGDPLGNGGPERSSRQRRPG
jgi:dienelactone hydrolase